MVKGRVRGADEGGGGAGGAAQRVFDRQQRQGACAASHLRTQGWTLSLYFIHPAGDGPTCRGARRWVRTYLGCQL